MKTSKFSKRTLGLVAVGAVSLAAMAQAEETPSSVMTALSSTTLSGFVDTSAQWNPGTGNANNPAYLFGGANKADGFNLNVVKLMLEKDPQPSDGWGAGYKVDLLFGPDANTYGTQSTGTFADFAVKQAYVDLKVPIANGLDFKIGVWDTILGYEVFENSVNANFTRSYGYTIEPATFTGVLGSYNITELIGVAAGVANVTSSTINGRAFPTRAESYKAYMGDISLTAPTSWKWAAGSTLYVGVVNGFSALPGSTGFTHPADQFSLYVGTTISTPIKALKLGASYDYEGAGKQAISGSGYANAVSLYTTYQITEKMSLNTRGEWFTQSKGNVGIGYPSKVLALTGTLQYDLWKNVISRLELRWDHSADGTLAYGGTTAGTPTRKNAYELIANVVYKF
ncbi:MAG: hypothetical protein JWR19_417 [Pedosphaera sp.]|nr:hypothetical protein [Pedosphaera sp.]